MLKVVITEPAQLDSHKILLETLYEYGEDGKVRYERLIAHAVKTIAVDPDIYGTSEIAPGYQSYHLRLSKKKVAYKEVRVKNPPHMIVYRVAGDTLYVVRILHEVMQHKDHL